MDKRDMTQARNEAFVMPRAEILVFSTEDVITTSGGGFIGDWDEDVSLPKIGF